MLISIFILGIACGLMLKTFKNHQSEKRYFHKQMLAFCQRRDQNTPKGSVVFLGDSHIQGLCTCVIACPSVNLGIGGETVSDLSNRISSYSSLPESRAVVIASGVNDLMQGANPNQVVSRLLKLLENLPKKVPVFLNLLFKVDESASLSLAGLNRKIASTNILIKKKIRVLKRNTHIFVLDPNQALESPDGLPKKFHCGDGIHLNAKGYRAWTKILKERLRQSGT